MEVKIGDKVPADIKILKASQYIKVDDSFLTGRSKLKPRLPPLPEGGDGKGAGKEEHNLSQRHCVDTIKIS